ncbi:hypothetical protein B0A55_08517 [Friedmanniomyces simplex]|uniref:Uncharacterized protein n=1 Tax=Friedmanniomyces simplex TaxID=329884 RepID=A0A4U0WZI9_9PEZI|nr:hypothetical protein B0A55_08517 [Friedmanniomyces simplex]
MLVFIIMVIAAFFVLVASVLAGTDLATLSGADNLPLNLTERDVVSFDPGRTWREYGFFRQNFYLYGLSCADISSWFDLNQLSTLPKNNDKNLQCWATPMPGYLIPLQFDISTFNDDPGRLAMACALSSIMGANGNPTRFCTDPTTQKICCTNGTPS